MTLPVDHEQRIAALNPLRSICVTAPAGSGKTELLSQRVLQLLAIVEQPEEILAITFTRKAAAEMHHRIIQALLFAQHTDAPTQAHQLLSWQLARKALARNKECNWQLLENTNRLQVQTIDSLCSSLTRRMPILSTFGAQPTISQQPERSYQAAVHSLLSELEANTPVSEDIENLLIHLDNDMGRAERLLVELLKKRDQWLIHIGLGGSPDQAKQKLEQTLQHIIIDTLSNLRGLLQPFSADLLPFLDYAGCNMQWQNSDSSITKLAGIIELPAVDAESVDLWLAIAELFLTKKNEWRKTINATCGFPPVTEDGDKVLAKTLKKDFLTLVASIKLNQALLDSLIELRHLPPAHYNLSQWQLLETMTRLLPRLVAELVIVFQERGEVDYSQISMAALQALGDSLNPTDIAMTLDYKLSHILVDEFQDTASTQFQLLERLVEGWQEHNANNPQSPHTLFIVGDGMQSIYGFRQANVGLFLEARNKGVNNVVLDDLYLTVNFRSDPLVVDWINQVFSQAFPPVENLGRGAVPFEKAHSFNQPDNHSDIKVRAFSSEQTRSDQADEVITIVRRSQQLNPEGSIAILVRSRSHLKEIIPVLMNAGLSWNATDIDPLMSYGFIKDMVSLTKALSNIADRISWTALLRTPWLGLNNSDLTLLLANDTNESIWAALIEQQPGLSLSTHANERLESFVNIISAAFEQRNRRGLRSWVEGVWLALGGAASLLSSDEFKLVDDYFDLLESHQQGASSFNMDEFEQAIEHLFAAPQSTHSTIHLMTIHKSKGLEFDTVILPGLTRRPRGDDNALLMWREYLSSSSMNANDNGSGLIISPSSTADKEGDPLYEHLKFEKAAATALENTRLFYVAATRAIKQLYLLVDAEQKEDSPEITLANKQCLISSAWGGLQEKVEWVGQPLMAVNDPVKQLEVEQFGLDFDEPDSKELNRLVRHWQAPSWNFTNPLSDYYINTEPVEGLNRPELPTDPAPACVGTVCHAIFEELVIRGSEFWLEMASDKKTQWLESLLHYNSLPPIAVNPAIDQILLAVNNTLNDPKGQWVLSSKHDYSKTELALLSNFSGQVKQRVIDRCFMDEKGDYWVVDYKTSTPANNESMADFIDREEATYRSQLLDYKILLAKVLQEDKSISSSNIIIRTALYFTYYPCFHELVF